MKLPILIDCFSGLGYGCTWTAIPVIISEYFGVPRFATHWGAMTMLPAIGGSLTSLIFSLIYDHSKTTKSNDPNQSPPPPHQPQGKCHGVDCFRASYLFCMGLSIVCIATVCLVAIRRGRRHHRRRRPHAS